MGAGHGHNTDDVAGAFDARLVRWCRFAAIALGAVTLVGLVWLWPSGTPRLATDSRSAPDATYPATVVTVDRFDCPGAGDASGGDGTGSQDGAVPAAQGSCANVTFRLSKGPDAGSQKTVVMYGMPERPALDEGDAILVPYTGSAPEPYRYSNQFERERGLPMLILALLFAVLVVVQGGLKGLSALAGLTISIGVVLVFVLPALVDGTPPVAVAITAASLIAFMALYLAHGVTALTTVALLGTLVSLGLVAVLSALFTELTSLSGLTEESQYIGVFGGDLDVSGLLLAGIILGTLGALDDMTVTQTSAVAELAAANPDLGPRGLYRGAIRIGRDHVASTVNTLALAYIGASLPLLLVFILADQSFGRALTSEVVATEVVRTLVGSIGLVASVPITTALAARVARAPSTTSTGD